MWFNKCIVVYILSLLFSTVVFADQWVWFIWSVAREDIVDIPEKMVSAPISMASSAMQMHLDHFNRTIWSDAGILWLTRIVQVTIKSDIVTLLDSSVDKQNLLSSYLWHMQDVLQDATAVLDTTIARIDVFVDGLNSCLEDKQLADNDFFQAIQDNDDAWASRALEQSLVASDCVTSYRVRANALQAQYDKLQFYTTILQKKYNYIDQQQWDIVSYFRVLRPALLKDLTTIASELQSFVLTR